MIPVKVEARWRDEEAQYRIRCRAALAAGTALTVVAAMFAATASPSTVGVVLTVLAGAAVLAMLNAAWWLARPGVCFGRQPHVNGSAALAAVLFVATTVAIVVNIVTGGSQL